MIVAAPDLLEVVLSAIPLLERDALAEARSNRAPTGLPPRTEARDRLARAREAIAKATGSSDFHITERRA